MNSAGAGFGPPPLRFADPPWAGLAALPKQTKKMAASHLNNPFIIGDYGVEIGLFR